MRLRERFSGSSGTIGRVVDWISRVIDSLGPLGVGLLIALETIIPPIPSEVILPLAGFRASAAAMNPIVVWLAATAGSLVAAVALYWLGAWLGYERLHRLAGRRWFFVATQRDVDRGCRLFERHGSWIVAAGRCVPVLRTLVSLPAGITRMRTAKFLALTALGSGIWNAVFIWLGWVLADNWREVEHYTGPASIVVLALFVAALIVLAVRRRRAARPAPEKPRAEISSGGE
jgi:membrane protein DedA with SNARE-associated domain